MLHAVHMISCAYLLATQLAVFPAWIFSAVATALGAVGAHGVGGDPGAEDAGRFPSLHAEKPRNLFRGGVRGRGAGEFKNQSCNLVDFFLMCS